MKDSNIMLGNNSLAPYLISQNIIPAIKKSLYTDPFISEIFGKNIATYLRTDWGTNNYPAISIYRTGYDFTSVNSYETGDIGFAIHTPTSVNRGNAQEMTVALTRYVSNYLQSPSFIYAISDYVIPTPSTENSNYEYIKDFKERNMGLFKEIFQRIKVELPKFSDTVWVSYIIGTYKLDMQNWMYFLENAGIDYTHPNKISYPVLETWLLYVREKEFPPVEKDDKQP